MTITTRRVTGPIVLPDGSAPANGRVIVALAGWDREDGQGVMAGPITISLDEYGVFDAELWCTDTGENGRVYTGLIRWFTGAEWRSQNVQFDVPSGAGDLSFAPIWVVGDLPPSTQADALAQCLAAATQTALDRVATGEDRAAAEDARDAAIAAAEFRAPSMSNFLARSDVTLIGSRWRIDTGEVLDVVAAGAGDYNHPISGRGVICVKGAETDSGPSVFHDFGSDSNHFIAAGERLDSGQSIGIAGTANNLPRVIDGELRFLDPASPTTGTGYVHIDAGRPITQIGCRFVFHEGSVADNVLATVIKTASGETLAALAHPIFYRDRWVMQVRPVSDPSALIVVGQGRYREAMADGATYDVCIRFDPAENSVTIIDPFGDAQLVTSTLIDETVCGQYAYWQVHNVNASADDFGIVRIHAQTDVSAAVGAGDARDPVRLAGALSRRLEDTLPISDSLTFTPTSTGWWRVWTATGLPRFDGEMHIECSTGADNLTSIVVDLGLAAFSNVPDISLSQRNWLQFNSAVSQIRAGNNTSNTLYLDIYVAYANKPITVKLAGPGVPTMSGLRLSQMTPTSGPMEPTRAQTLVLGPGLRSGGALFGAWTEVGVETVTSSALGDQEVHLLDGTAGAFDVTPSGGIGRKHSFCRIDGTANAVRVIGYFSDGTTAKVLTGGQSLTIIRIATSGAKQWMIV